MKFLLQIGHIMERAVKLPVFIAEAQVRSSAYRIFIEKNYTARGFPPTSSGFVVSSIKTVPQSALP
jgi:hypothetical protein